MVQAPNPLGKKKAVYTTRLPRRTEKCGMQPEYPSLTNDPTYLLYPSLLSHRYNPVWKLVLYISKSQKSQKM